MSNKIAFDSSVRFGTKILRHLAAFVISVFAWQIAFAAPSAGALDPTFTGGVTEGLSMVFTVAGQPDGKILVGGSFAHANGAPRTNLARLNADGSLDAAFNAGGAGLDTGDVRGIVVQPDGKILIVGLFGSYNGTARQSIARLNADGTLDATFNPGTNPNNTTFAVALQADGKILVGGSFTSFNGTVRTRIARLNADGTLDATFTPGNGANQTIYKIVVQPDGKILIGGNFTNYNGTARSRLVRLNADGTLDATFNPSGAGADTTVYAITLQSDGKILIGGFFQQYNEISRQQIARLNADGTLDLTFEVTAFPPSPTTGLATSYVYSINLQPDGKILAAGYFGFTGNNDGKPIVRFNTDGSLDATFTAPQANSQAFEIVQQADGKIFLGGSFTTFAGAERIKTARINADGTLDAAFPVTNFTGIALVRAINQQADGKILVGGSFRMANGAVRRNIARFNADGSVDTTFNATGFGADNDVTAIGIQPDGKIVIGGLFQNYNGAPRQGLARLNADGTLDATFSTNFIVTTTEEIIPVADGKILIAGLATIGGFSNAVYRLNPNGSVDNTFIPASANGNARTIAIQPDGAILVGGNFTVFKGIARNRLARLRADGALDASFNPGTGANLALNKLVLQPDGKFLIGGQFTNYNGVSRNHIARVNADGSVDTTFNPGSTGFVGFVYSLVLQADGKVLVGGHLTAFNETPIFNLARLNADGSFDASFASGFPAYVAARYVFRLFLQSDGKVLVGGIFTQYAGVPRNSLLRLQTSAARRTLFDFDGDGRADQAVFRPSERNWYLLRSGSGFAAAQFGDANDRIVPADYDGDSRADIAVFRAGVWYILQSSNNQVRAVSFGTAEDLPRPADYDGDGRADIGVFRQSSGTWFYLRSSDNGFRAIQFGQSGDAPVMADFDADGKSDIAVFRPSNGVWYWLRSSDNQFQAAAFGQNGDIPLSGDFNGDGRSDLAVFRPSNATWYVAGTMGIPAPNFQATQFGLSTDTPVPADYDGDGKTDIAVFRGGVWYILRSQQGFGAVQFGTSGDRPIPAAFVPQN